jgi:hypothetical protein
VNAVRWLLRTLAPPTATVLAPRLALAALLSAGVACDPIEPAPHPPLPGPLAGTPEGSGEDPAPTSLLDDPNASAANPSGDAGPEAPQPADDMGALARAPNDVTVTSVGATGPDAGATVAPPVVMSTLPFGTPDLGPPPPPRGHSLREVYRAGQSLRRVVRAERRYRLRVESNLMANAEGASELHREYALAVDRLGPGHIAQATIRMLGDERRILPVGETRPRTSVEDGPLQRDTLACESAGSGYRCEGRDVRADGELVGVYPQRTLLAAPELMTPGDTWELAPDRAREFLGLSSGEVAVRFVYAEAGVPYREELCRRVTYVIEGEVPVEVFGESMPGRLSGSGEYLLCLPSQLILNHRQQRHLEVSGTVQRQGRATPVERAEELILEEETFPMPTPAATP